MALHLAQAYARGLYVVGEVRDEAAVICLARTTVKEIIMSKGKYKLMTASP